MLLMCFGLIVSSWFRVNRAALRGVALVFFFLSLVCCFVKAAGSLAGSVSLAPPDDIEDEGAGGNRCGPVEGVAGSMHSRVLPPDTLTSSQHPARSCKRLNTSFIVSPGPFCQAPLLCLFPLRSAIVAAPASNSSGSAPSGR